PLQRRHSLPDRLRPTLRGRLGPAPRSPDRLRGRGPGRAEMAARRPAGAAGIMVHGNAPPILPHLASLVPALGAALRGHDELPSLAPAYGNHLDHLCRLRPRPCHRPMDGNPLAAPAGIPASAFSLPFPGMEKENPPPMMGAPESNGAIRVVIPALNEEKAIALVLKAVPGFAAEVIVADNGSTDATAATARSLGATVVPEPRRGYGAACLRGMA